LIGCFSFSFCYSFFLSNKNKNKNKNKEEKERKKERIERMTTITTGDNINNNTFVFDNNEQALISQVEHAIRLLYAPNTQRNEAQHVNSWLTALQESDHIWKVADSLLCSADATIEARFFAANGLVTKTKSSMSRLSTDAIEGLRKRLISYLALYLSAPPLILRQLVTAVALSFVLGSEGDACRSMATQCQQALPDALAGVPLLMALSSFAECVSQGSSLSERRREELRKSMKPIVPQVLVLVKNELINSKDRQHLRLALSCLTVWVSVLRLGLAFIVIDTPDLFPVLLNLLSKEEVFLYVSRLSFN